MSNVTLSGSSSTSRVFFVLEIIVLIATKPSDKPVIPVIKDAIYMLAYGIFLIAAIPGTGE